MSNRLKLLRKTYGITIDTLSNLSNLPALQNLELPRFSGSAIVYWEASQKIPSADKLKTYASIFGVSSDWLIGISNVPYTNESIQYGEQTFFDYISFTYPDRQENRKSEIHIKYLDERNEFNEVKEDYLYPEKRISAFSLDVRANILVLLYLLHNKPSILGLYKDHFIKEYTLGNKYTESQKAAFYTKVTNIKTQTASYHDNLLKLLSTHKTTPIYVIKDIEKTL